MFTPIAVVGLCGLIIIGELKVEILGMKESVEVAETRVGNNMKISARLVIDMAERAKHADTLADALEDCAELLLKISFESSDEYQAAMAALAAYRSKS